MAGAYSELPCSITPSFCHSIIIHFTIIITTIAHIQLKFDIIKDVSYEYTGWMQIEFQSDDFWQSCAAQLLNFEKIRKSLVFAPWRDAYIKLIVLM